MSKVITNRQNTNKRPFGYPGVIEASIFKVFAGYIKISDYPIPRRRQYTKKLGSSTVVIIPEKNSQYIAPQSLDSPKEQNMASDSLTMRAIQAFMDTEDEWAGVYANLAES